MSEIIIRDAPFGSPLYHEVTGLRRGILRKPLGLDFTPEELAIEKDDIHLAACTDSRVVGTLLIRLPGNGVAQIKRMAVAADAQGRGTGRMLVEHAEGLMRQRGDITKIMMHARSTARGFYERCGYTAIGQEFPEQGIPHIVMEKRL